MKQMFSLKSLVFFYDPVDVGNLISGSSVFSKSSLNIWKFSVHILLKPGLENFEHYFACVWNECNCVVVWRFFGITFIWDSIVAQRLKLLPATWETWVRSLGLEDPPEKEMATHSSILAWRIPWMEELGGLQSNGVTKSRTWLSDFTFTFTYLGLEWKLTFSSPVTTAEFSKFAGISLALTYLITGSLYLLTTFSNSPSPTSLPLVTTNMISFSVSLFLKYNWPTTLC